jgi:DNA-binding protein HU-beta
VRKKKERVSVSPSTGVKMLVPPKLVLTYKPSLVLKEKVNTKNYGEEV